jgi:hypothetical protein
MRAWFLPTLWLAMAAAAGAAPIDLKQRTISSSGQFVVYSADAPLRSRVASFAEELRGQVAAVLGLGNGAGQPIVITLDRAAAGHSAPAPVEFALVQVESGFKVQIDVHIGENPAEVNLQRHIVRALLLEFAYRETPAAVRGGEAYVEAPWWLVEGTLQIIRKRDAGVAADLFKRIIDANKLPSLEQFLAARHQEIEGATVFAIDQACAMCLVQALLDQPDGRADFTRFLHHLPESKEKLVAEVLRDFPSLTDEAALQKAWTLSLARFSAADRYEGLSPTETDAQLQTLLRLEIATGKADEKKAFALGDFEEFLKLPGSKPALLGAQGGLIALSTRASILHRTVIADYEQIIALMLRGKTHGLKERLARSQEYRDLVLKRTAEISDYLNWFEATQLDTRSDAFDGYLKAANELAVPPKHDDPISKYLDAMESEF